MSESAVTFWRGIVTRLLSEQGTGDIDRPPDADRLVEVGQETHLLEWYHSLSVGQNSGRDGSSGLFEAARRQRTMSTFRNKLLRALIQRMDDRVPDLPYAWLKGAVFLRGNVYPRGVRRMSDVDLLVRREQLQEWDRVLNECGFECYRDPAWLRDESMHETVSSSVYFGEVDDHRVMIDLHWHLVDFPVRRAMDQWDFSMEPIWSRVNNHRMAPEHRYIYLLDHAFTHNFYQWKFAVDLYQLSSVKLDEEFLREEASRMGMEVSVALGREVIEKLWTGSGEPNWLDDRGFKPSGETAFLERVARHSTHEGDYLKICLNQQEGIIPKLKFLLWILLAPVSAIPGVARRPSGVEWIKIYGKRIWRVLTAGSGILFRN